MSVVSAAAGAAAAGSGSETSDAGGNANASSDPGSTTRPTGVTSSGSGCAICTGASPSP
ncbi:MAG: hypothetical protein JWM93_2772, partial [Frankiales bacterium]|nr:hypothetical protein [Frankiales bacterium]